MELSKAKRMRGSAKARVTAFRNYILSAWERLESGEKLTNVEITQIEQRSDRIGEVFSDYDRHQTQLELLVQDEQIDEIYAEREEFERSYYEIVAKARCVLIGIRGKAGERVGHSGLALNGLAGSDRASMCGSVRGDEDNESHNSEHASEHEEDRDDRAKGKSVTDYERGPAHGRERGTVEHIRLPVLKLPQFDGSYHKWLAFYDTFKAVIHSNDTISAVQKFQYLSNALTDDAAQVIKGLEISSVNYSSAWELLEKRYQNKTLMIHNHIKGIVEYARLNKQNFSLLRGLLNTLQGHMRALKALQQSVDNWDSLLIYIIADKFDLKTKVDWERWQIKQNGTVSVPDLIEFIEKQCQLLEKTDRSNRESVEQPRGRESGRQTQGKTSTLTFSATSQSECPFCNGSHAIFHCKKFRDLPILSRIAEIKRQRRCLNCFRSGHYSFACKAQGCRKCNKMHNTMLHLQSSNSNEAQNGDNNEVQDISLSMMPDRQESIQSTTSNYSGGSVNISHVLPTAVIQVLDNNSVPHECTVLLDSGSQSNFMSKRFSQVLKLNAYPVQLNVVGVNQSRSNVSEAVQATIKSKNDGFQAKLSFLISDKITSIIPSEPIDLNKLSIPKHMKLADPQFYKPKGIDILLGIEVFWDLICPDSEQHPYLQKTRLGYVVSGRVPRCGQVRKSTACNCSVNHTDISRQLRQFWELEECPRIEKYSSEEKACEESFIRTIRRNKEGRFIVSIPFKGSLSSLGESKEQAKRRFLHLERQLQGNAPKRERYIKFMQQYENLGHMTKVKEDHSPEYSYYLPHHGVIKGDSLTTKLRVVFDGSAESSTGVSINQLQMVGPTVQDDLFSIVLRFRMHPFVVGADIAMMYRQILVEPNQRPLQRVLWRSDPSQPMEIFNLNTITYGLASSSFLAIRCLLQLADEHERDYPKAAEVIRHSMYVDDLLYGASTIDEAVQIGKEVSEILSSAGFQLRKWISNDPGVLSELSASKETLQHHVIKLGEGDVVNTLGLSWSTARDELAYSIFNNLEFDTGPWTKRSILSIIARIYDSLGLLSPWIISAKMILQQLWHDKSPWDQGLSPEIHAAWRRFMTGMVSLRDLRIPRSVCLSKAVVVEIHAFSDASEAAYGAAIYIRSIDLRGGVSANLLCAKSRVAPLKTASIPRLELCAAQVSSRLVEKVKAALDVGVDRTYYWCDSTIVLSWLRIEPYKLKTFVGNRVAEIQSLSTVGDWHHVPSSENPADLLSRGVDPVALCDSQFWWHGPDWLSSNEIKHTKPYESSDLPELKPVLRVTAIVRLIPSLVEFKNYSSLMAMNWLVRTAQMQSFPLEFSDLREGREISPKSRLVGLNPFLHKDGTLRVGGRLANSHFEFDKQHPRVLCSKHQLTVLIFRAEHLRLLHVGPQALLSCIRDKYWPISGRSLARKTVHACVRCAKANPKSFKQLMGNLPRDRVTPMPAFYVTGVDYAGPLLIKDRRGRGGKTSKCYIALFICFASRAIHLELVSDLTTDCFILALRRFASRWGMPARIRSDNGTNFVGASSELKELGEFLKANEASLTDRFTKEQFHWKFIPAYSPHFGGLWEAGVKSAKSHLKRVLGNALLTFEELYSVLAQVGAILNSRPLTPLSADPSDLQSLTPAHLLVGRSMTSVPDPDVTYLPEARLSRYQRIQQLQQHFWARWSKEYISELQFRTKWKTRQQDVQEGALVLVKDDKLPTMRWRLGRVIQLHPGVDSMIRAVTLRTQRGDIKRAVSKLCPLPIEDSVRQADVALAQ